MRKIGAKGVTFLTLLRDKRVHFRSLSSQTPQTSAAPVLGAALLFWKRHFSTRKTHLRANLVGKHFLQTFIHLFNTLFPLNTIAIERKRFFSIRSKIGAAKMRPLATAVYDRPTNASLLSLVCNNEIDKTTRGGGAKWNGFLST